MKVAVTPRGTLKFQVFWVEKKKHEIGLIGGTFDRFDMLFEIGITQVVYNKTKIEDKFYWELDTKGIADLRYKDFDNWSISIGKYDKMTDK